MIPGPAEEFTAGERARLAPHFSTLDGPVFALTNLPEVVKGALFARYSRSAKSLRRLFLDEFAGGAESPAAAAAVGVGRAESLYERVFVEYGDDSVAQLGGVHLACEGVSNVLTKLLEWGRLMAYLEQSTRYVAFEDRPGGQWRYAVPPEVDAAGLGDRFRSVCDAAFEIYARWLEPLQAIYRERFEPSGQLGRPYAMPALHVTAADSDAEARRLFTSTQQAIANLLRDARAPLPEPIDDVDAYWTPAEKARAQHMLKYSVVGSPERVRQGLARFIAQTKADEIMVATLIHDHKARLRSFEIVADVMKAMEGESAEVTA